MRVHSQPKGELESGFCQCFTVRIGIAVELASERVSHAGVEICNPDSVRIRPTRDEKEGLALACVTIVGPMKGHATRADHAR
jgi:hypothetical protein